MRTVHLAFGIRLIYYFIFIIIMRAIPLLVFTFLLISCRCVQHQQYNNKKLFTRGNNVCFFVFSSFDRCSNHVDPICLLFPPAPVDTAHHHGPSPQLCGAHREVVGLWCVCTGCAREVGPKYPLPNMHCS